MVTDLRVVVQRDILEKTIKAIEKHESDHRPYRCNDFQDPRKKIKGTQSQYNVYSKNFRINNYIVTNLNICTINCTPVEVKIQNASC